MKLTGKQRCCPVCGEILEVARFHNSPNPHHDKVIPICKDCLGKLYTQYYTTLNRPDAAMWCVCARIDIPFLQNVWAAVVEGYEERYGSRKLLPPISKYLEKLAEVMPTVDGFHQSDRMLDAFIEVEKPTDTAETDIEVERRRKRQRKEWGEFEDDDLDYLDDQYAAYTTNMVGMDKITSMRYHDLCKAELSKRKADLSGDYGDINKARDNVFAIMKLLKLDNFKGNERSDEDKRIEKIIWNIENTKPCECEDLEKYKDFSDFGKHWDTIMRCVQNLICGTKAYPSVPRSEKG